MADTSVSSGAENPEGETPNQRQARLRREKRQKKMAEQGEDRLAKIKALNGGVAPPEEALGGPVAGGPKAATVEDPDEVDIDTVSGAGTPSGRATNAQSNPLAAAMLQQQQAQQNAGDEDPMVKMMQQLQSMMGSMGGGDPNNPNQQPELPPMLQNMLKGGAKGQEAVKQPATGSAYVWRITHAIFAFALAIYITMTSTFNGSALSRSQSVYDEQTAYNLGPRLFWMFATAELLLQSTRYFLEGGKLQGGGPLATVANSGFVPEPYAHYIRVVGRYIAIAQTIFADVMVVVFVFGCFSWYRGMAIA
ncbi:Hypothetical protein R9X50_00637100 [Acrodontium crateriforme]|uniref:Uncharacterized protein n=1 Tax=Acrodontium crateriforme TaxID=150365 RepID=A0AAQ3MBG2_9PEZI|nr:Hypothetical protein R9X50_00637100 [Acrodontium crateriforme]